MSFLSFLLQFFFSDIYSTIITIFIAYVVYKLSKFYITVLSLPPGPTPLPIIGNILLFRSELHFESVFREVNRKYGPVFTFWLGNTPSVFVADLDIGRDTFRKNEFAGRPESYFGSALSNSEFQDVIFSNGHTWEALRRVTHSAAQKYSTNDKLVYLANDCVDCTVQEMIKQKGVNKQFDPFNYIYLIFLNIIASSTFGISYSVEDEEFKKFKYVLRDFAHEVGNRFLLWEFSPIIRLLDRKLVKKQRQLMNGVIELLTNRFISHYEDYNPSIERDFCDALISAKNDALREGKESAPYLTDANLAVTLFDVLFAGTDTSQQTFRWMVLFIAYYPEVQQKLRHEIENQIGDRIPTHEDRNRCHYVMAFIAEIMRFRNVVPTGLPHKAVVESKLGNYTIPKDMNVFLYHGAILTEENHWPNAQEFRPERFLENGKYMTTRSKAFIPFGFGRRVCLGERLAIADLFLVLVRFLQMTNKYDIILGDNSGLEADPNKNDSFTPHEYKIILKTK